VAFDHELKLGRALDHLVHLDELVKPWIEGKRHTTRCEVDPNNGMRTYFATAEQPSKDVISPVIGDVLHNLRSALDNLAYALAGSYTKPLPPEYALASEFPIFGDRDKSGAIGVGHGNFHKVRRDGSPAPGSGLAKIQGWHPNAQTIVEGLQPYKKGNLFESEPLWILHELDRIDKHRLLHTAVAGIASASLFGNPGDRNLAGIRNGGTLEALGGAIETDTPYFRVTGITLIPIDPSKEVYMDVPVTIHVSFAPGTPYVENQPVYKALADLYAYVARTVMPKFAAFI
jgi:hypothetical protein